MRVDIPFFLTSPLMPLKDSTRVILGLNRLTDDEREQLLYFNLFGGGILAIVTCVIELWMLLQSVMGAQNPDVIARVGWSWIIQHRIAYVVQLLSALALLGASLYKYVRGKIGRMTSSVALGQFIVTCIIFGLYISLQDISRDHAAYALLTELIAVACIFSIRPALFAPAVLASLGIAMGFASQRGMLSHGEAVNLCIFFVITTISGCMRYYTTIRIIRNNIELNRRAHTDGLTGLGNVESMRKDLATLGYGEVTVTMLDIDNLKSCNDQLGHACGNTAIVLLANALNSQFKGVGQSYRVGGDEFVVITTELSRSEHEERVRATARAFAHSCDVHGLLIHGSPLTVSVGTAAGTVHTSQDFDVLCQRADKVMYQQKHA